MSNYFIYDVALFFLFSFVILELGRPVFEPKESELIPQCTFVSNMTFKESLMADCTRWCESIRQSYVRTDVNVSLKTNTWGQLFCNCDFVGHPEYTHIGNDIYWSSVVELNLCKGRAR